MNTNPQLDPNVYGYSGERVAERCPPLIECGSGGMPRNMKGATWRKVEGKWVRLADGDAVLNFDVDDEPEFRS